MPDLRHSHHSTDRAGGRATFGSVLLFLGVTLLALLLLDAGYGLPVNFPRSWYLHRTLWGLLGCAAIVGGWKLQSGSGNMPATWSPGAPGKRFRRLIVYSRPECHLCDEAKAVLANYLDYLPEIEEVDIDRDPDLKERFGTTIPVVELDGQIRFRGRVDEILLRRLIEGTPPIRDHGE